MAKKILSLSVIVCFFLTTLNPIPKASADPGSNLPQSNIISLTGSYSPLLVKGMTVYPQDPFRFDFIVDTGKTGLSGQALNDEAMKMIKYFLASLTVPEKEMWVNLSPIEKNRIIPQSFGQTDMGRDLLTQDFMLKKLTSSLIYPESQLGKQFWSAIYSKISQKYGTTNVPVNTFNKVWILPDTASVYEHGNQVYVVNSHLKVMLESDYNLMQKLGDRGDSSMTKPEAEMTKVIIRQIVLPAIEKEVNEGEHFVLLRQMYKTMILASWYKTKLRNSILNQVYSNKDKINGIDIADKNAKEKIYRSYLDLYRKGVYNYIKEEIDPATNQIVPKKYFSGGADFQALGEGTVKEADVTAAMSALSGDTNDAVISWTGNPAQKSDAASISVIASIAANIMNFFRNLKSAYYFGFPVGTKDPLTGEDLPIYSGSQKEAKEELGGKGEGLARMSSPANQEDFHEFVGQSGLPRSLAFIKKAFEGDEKGLAEAMELYNNPEFRKSLRFDVPAGFTLPVTETAKWYHRMGLGDDSIQHDLSDVKAFLKDIGKTDDPRNNIDWSKLEGYDVSSIKDYLDRLKPIEDLRGPLGGTEGLPFYTAVRSGASVSMPGMMDTILNLGINDDNVLAFERKGRPEGSIVTEEDSRFAWDTYRREIEFFGRTVLGIHESKTEGFKQILDKIRLSGTVDKNTITSLGERFVTILSELIARGIVIDEVGTPFIRLKPDLEENRKVIEEIAGNAADFEVLWSILDRNETRLTSAEYKEAVKLYKEELKRQGLVIPHNPYLQYLMAIATVMRSTFGERALEYRQANKLDLVKTLSAVNIVPMVYGNRNDLSGTGVGFSRNVDSGEDTFKVEFARKTQGEDVVAGRIDQKSVHDLGFMLRDPETREAAIRLMINMEFLEHNAGDAQDVEFTFEYDEVTKKTTLYMLQTRNAKRNARSAINIAYDLINEEIAYQERIKGKKLDKKETLEIIYQRLKTIDPNALRALLVKVFDQESKKAAIDAGKLVSEKGTLASMGGAVGHVVFTAEKAKEIVEKDPKAKVILVTEETTTHDFGGMKVSQAILTLKGGFTSHAAVVARQMGTPAIVSVQNMRLVHEGGVIKAVFSVRKDGKVTEVAFNEGDMIAVDATNTQILKIDSLDEIKLAESPTVIQQNYHVGIPLALKMIEQNKILASRAKTPDQKTEYEEHIKTYEAFKTEAENSFKANPVSDYDQRLYQRFRQIQQWAADVRQEFGGLGIRANAEEPKDVLNAVLFGAEGLGLVRTEHMFMMESRLINVQKMFFSLYNKNMEIDADARAQLKVALSQLLPYQQSDFEQIFMLLDGKPATIRLLDPPMHEILPHGADQILALAKAIYGENVTQDQIDEVSRRIDTFRENNPMFGTRGVRLGVLIPELVEMQSRAIFNAKKAVEGLERPEGGYYTALPEVMIPLVGNVEEFMFAGDIVQKVAKEMGLVRKKDYYLGTMIEIIAGILNAKKLAKVADFFSFGTNDETQGALGLSRDDGAEYISKMLQMRGTDSPFASLNPIVAEFTLRAVQAALEVDPKFKLGICGDQGTDPNSIINYLAKWLTYVSGNAMSLPGANIAAASEAKVEKVKGAVRSEVKINTTRYRVDTGILPGQSIEEQLAEAVEFLREHGATDSNVRAVLSQIVLPEDMQKYHDLADNADLKQLMGYIHDAVPAKDAKVKAGRMTVGQEAYDVSNADAQEKNNDIINMDAVISSDADLSLAFKKYLLLRAKDPENIENIRLIVDAIHEALPRKLGKGGTDEELTFTLPSQPLSSYFNANNTSLNEADFKQLAASLDISVEEVKRLANTYDESNPVIGERGARLISKQATHDLYRMLVTNIIVEAHAAGYRHVNIVLPYIEGKTHLDEILNGRKNGNDVYLSPLNDSIHLGKLLAGGEDSISVKIGVSIDVPSATAIAGGAADIATLIQGPIIFNVDGLTETIWSTNEGDFFKPGAVGPKYAEDIWHNEDGEPINIFKETPPDVRGLIQEAILKVKSEISYKGKVLVKTSNPTTDARLMRDVRAAGADGIIVAEHDPVSLQAATLEAAKASAVYRINAAMTAAGYVALSSAQERAQSLSALSFEDKLSLGDALTKNTVAAPLVSEVKQASVDAFLGIEKKAQGAALQSLSYDNLAFLHNVFMYEASAYSAQQTGDDRLRVLELFDNEFEKRAEARQAEEELGPEETDASMSARTDAVSNDSQVGNLKANPIIAYAASSSQARREIRDELDTPKLGQLADELKALMTEDREHPLLDHTYANLSAVWGETLAAYDLRPDKAAAVGDHAQGVDPFGGINFDAGMLNMTIQRDGNGMPLPVNQQPGIFINLPGLRPIITHIQYSVNVPQMLNLNSPNK